MLNCNTKEGRHRMHHLSKAGIGSQALAAAVHTVRRVKYGLGRQARTHTRTHTHTHTCTHLLQIKPHTGWLAVAPAACRHM